MTKLFSKTAKITLDVSIGDTVLMGKFKNSKKVVKKIDEDDHGMPRINGRVATTFRYGKKESEKTALSSGSVKKIKAILDRLRVPVVDKLPGLHDKRINAFRVFDNIDLGGVRPSGLSGGSDGAKNLKTIREAESRLVERFANRVGLTEAGKLRDFAGEARKRGMPDLKKRLLAKVDKPRKYTFSHEPIT